MDIKKLFLQLISVLLAMVVIVCIGTAIKRSGEPEKEYDFTEGSDSSEIENWYTEDTEGTEDTQVDNPVEDPDEDEPSQDVQETKTLYATAAVNVRSGPGRNYDMVGRLTKGATVTAVGDVKDEWQEVIFEGQKAYVKAEYLSTLAKQCSRSPAMR